MSVKYSHKVKSGNTLTSISQLYGISIQSIKDANSGINWTGERKGDRILAGEELKLPKEGNDFSGRGYQDGGGDNNQSKTSTENNTNNEISQEQKLRNLADYIRNSIYEVFPGTGVGPGNILNPFYKAEAIYGDIGSIYIAAEFDFGGFFILTGKDKGTFKKYFELGGGAAAELSAGVAYGRIDYTGNTNNFSMKMLYGNRKKGFVGAGWFGASKGLEVAVSKVEGGHTISTGISTSYGLSFPITGGYNEGEIAPKFKW